MLPSCQNKPCIEAEIFAPFCARFAPRNFRQHLVIGGGRLLTHWIETFYFGTDWKWLGTNEKGRRSGLFH